MAETKMVMKAGLVQPPGAGRRITIADLDITLKVTGAETDGAWALLEYHVPPHFAGFPRHWHKRYSESFYILAGTVTLQMEERIYHALPGSFVLAPPGMVHHFANQEDVPAMFLSCVAPSGLERFWEEAATLLPGDLSQITALAAHYDIHPAPASA